MKCKECKEGDSPDTCWWAYLAYGDQVGCKFYPPSYKGSAQEQWDQ